MLFNYDPYQETKYFTTTEANPAPEIVAEEKFAKPEFVRGLYLTAYSAGSENYRENIIASMKDSRINSVVIDIKDYSGYILYDSQIQELKECAYSIDLQL